MKGVFDRACGRRLQDLYHKGIKAEIFKAVHQVARPRGAPSAEQFAFVEGPLPVPGPGEALVENLYLSVDPYMREMMDGGWKLNAPLEGRSVGRVVESNEPALKPGQLVFHRQGWRTHAVVKSKDVRFLMERPGVPTSAYLGILGGTGLSAYIALAKVAKLEKGEDVFITSAAGGVGTAAGQIARLMGARRVVGSAGSPAKVRHLLDELHFDAAFDYHAGPMPELLAKAAPEGFHVCVENVGGEQLEAAIGAMRPHGRIAWVGAVAQYNDLKAPPPAPRNLYDVVSKSLRLEGFLVRDYNHAQNELEEFLAPHIGSGRVRLEETVVEGFENIVTAFLGVMKGANVGKMIVKAAQP